MEQKNQIRHPRTNKKRLWMILLSVFLVLAVGVVITAAVNKWKVRITLTGGDKIVAEAGKPFEDPGVKAEYYGSLLRFVKGEIPVKISGTVDVSTFGTYELTYEAEYKGMHQTKTRTVEVKDTKAPVITLKSNPDTYTLPNHPYTEEGYTATDNYDGDVTDKVTSEEKDGKVYYSVTDSSGNTGTVEREIVYDDKTPPTITLTGGAAISVRVNSEYHDQYRAEDDADGDITKNVQVEGSVDTSKEGTYQLHYKVKDSYGNEATAERTVTVKQMQNDMEADKLVYLSFDDGPGKYTERLLGILKKYNVKVTFFVTNQFPAYINMLKAEAADGHAVAVHTYTHNFAEVYANTDAYWADFDKINAVIEQQTGKKSTMFRFPGGSSNTLSKKYSPGIMTQLAQQAAQKGYTYFDWNVSSGDAGETKDSNQVAKNIINGISKHNTSVILCHDIHEYTVNAMDQVLSWATQNGYTFAPLTPESFQAHQKINN